MQYLISNVEGVKMPRANDGHCRSYRLPNAQFNVLAVNFSVNVFIVYDLF